MTPLLCGLLAISLLLQWRRFADPERQPWWSAWLVLGLAVLAKGPVAVVLTGMTLLLFGTLRSDLGLCLDAYVRCWSSHHCSGQPLVCPRTVDRGSAVLGQLFRLPQSSAVHQRGQRSFAAVVVLWPGDAGGRDALAPLLLLGLARLPRQRTEPSRSLHRFAGCWLLAVLICSPKRLPNFPVAQLPATPR